MREKIIKSQNPEEQKLCNQLTEMLTRGSNQPKERVDELDDINGPDLIKKFKKELPDVYKHNLDRCGGTLDNNFPSESDIRFILRINRLEQKSLDDFENGGRERLKNFLDSSLFQDIMNMK